MIERFIKAQKRTHATALQELKSGYKTTHWSWWEIPQIAGLGSSATSREYAIKYLAEANEFLENDELRLRLYEICEVLISIESSDAEQVMGYPDNLKLHSCMTLFQVASPDCEYFSAVLGKYYGGELDEVTLNILG
jgi:uncharacterized protein (DUF1810 family)